MVPVGARAGSGGNGGPGPGRIALFGATSGIAREVAAVLRSEGEELILIGRDAAALAGLARELGDESIPQVTWDVLDFASHGERFRALAEAFPLRGVFYAVGALFPQDECERDPARARLTFDVNLTSAALILDRFAAHFRAQGNGFISCVSSVAGDRGRGKVLAYGAAKAGLTAYLDGLRHRLAGSGVFVQTVKPGFVRTRMTEGLRSPLMAEPGPVARRIVSSLRARREVVYAPAIWRGIMLAIRLLPAPVFRRLKL
jgi:decaprenylphospho-beta-D-erythro-pentofuranosid-2-ulose 2-reductase